MRGVLMLAGLLAASAAAAQTVPAPVPVPGPPYDPTVRITNRGRTAINEVYVASAGVNEWGEDRLGKGSLRNGQSVVVKLPANQCVNDVRIVFDGGEAKERRRVNTCSENELVFP
ncbi:MAG TPA: hypothetical protein VE684_17155 [Crenalkalicoccus sp.]|nr:hypothetical protein [Crenalkalicoccus sp.]